MRTPILIGGNGAAVVQPRLLPTHGLFAGWMRQAVPMAVVVWGLLAVAASVVPPREIVSGLLDPNHGLQHAWSIWARNATFLLAPVLIALASVRSEQLRPALALLGLVVMGRQLVAVGGQASTLAAEVGVSPRLLLLMLPHAPLELLGFCLPIVAARPSRGGSNHASDLKQPVNLAVFLALALLVAAALVEAFVTPSLLAGVMPHSSMAGVSP